MGEMSYIPLGGGTAVEGTDGVSRRRVARRFYVHVAAANYF